MNRQLIQREIQIIESRKNVIDIARKLTERLAEARSRSCGTRMIEDWAWANIYTTIDANGGIDFLGTDICDLVQLIIYGDE